tara:strand:- start:14421 stop:14756 length:336 start_codon:yes stop_codon:yes gene_type:complete
MNNDIKAIVASYARSVLAAASGLFLAGITDPLDLAWSLVAALAPVLIRYINPNDPGFGRAPSLQDIEVALTDVKPVKAPRKKADAAAAVTAPAKKTSAGGGKTAGTGLKPR